MINQREFVAAALAPDKEVFVMHMAYLGAKMLVHLARKAQMALLLAKKISVPIKYADFSDVFFKKSVVVLSKHLDINEQATDLKLDKRLHYAPIYNLGPIELETLKLYIETNLANRFI